MLRRYSYFLQQITIGEKLVFENGLELIKTWDEVFQRLGRRQISRQTLFNSSSMVPQWISFASSESEEELWENLVFKAVGKSPRRSQYSPTCLRQIYLGRFKIPFRIVAIHIKGCKCGSAISGRYESKLLF
jgi:hypothetical protein